MKKFSKKTIQKLNIHLGKLKSITRDYENNYVNSINKNSNHSKIILKSKNLVKALLLESIFLNFEIRNLENKKISLFTKILLKNKQKFIYSNVYNNSYIVDTNKDKKTIKTENLRRYLNYFLNKLIGIYRKLFITIKTNFEYFTKNNPELIKIKQLFLIKEKVERYFYFLKTQILDKWYIYSSRFLLITFLNFIPFIQLTSILFYNQPNNQITHPITSQILNLIPFLLSTINTTMKTLNQDTTSFLLLFPYLYFFIYSYKRYKISRKVAYQGTFALALMLYRYSIILSQEALTLIYKFVKRFFLLKKYKSIDLLRDDISPYIEDLEEMRLYKEEIFQLGESIFSLDDLTKITRIWEATSIFSLLGVIALLYNYVYFIIRGKKAIIPVVSKTVRRMMVDRDVP